MARPERRLEEPFRGPRLVEPAPARPTSFAAVLSTVFGILALISVIVNVGGVIGPVVGIFLSVFALVFGAIGVGQVLSGNRKGMSWAIIGAILGLAALALGVLAAAFGIVLIPIRIVT